MFYNNNLTYRRIFCFQKKDKLGEHYHVNTFEENRCFSIQNKSTFDFDFFFYEPISVIYKPIISSNSHPSKSYKQKEIIVKNIYSTAQIEEYNKIYFYNNAFVIQNDKKIDYKIAKEDIYNYIINQTLTICNNIGNYKNYILEQKLFHQKIFNKEDFSKYFNDYFIYNNKNEPTFEYNQTENRRLFHNCYFSHFLFHKNLKFFNFCGPSSTGKSTTLLKLSRSRTGIVYLNLKKIHKLEEEADLLMSFIVKYFKCFLFFFVFC